MQKTSLLNRYLSLPSLTSKSIDKRYEALMSVSDK